MPNRGCPACGKTIGVERTQCPYCGVTVPPLPPPRLRFTKFHLRSLLLAAMLTMVAGCGLLTYACNTIVTFEDVSTDPRFSRLIGTDYQSTEELMIYGITVERGYAPILAYYRVTTLPGISGPEVLSTDRLAVGTTCRIVKVLRCTDCYLDFEERIDAVVEITSREEFTRAPVKIKLRLFEGAERAFVKIDR